MSHDFQNYSVHYRIMRSLPKRIRLSQAGRAYWAWVVTSDHRHIHCNPNDGLCFYCEETLTLPPSDRAYYWLERQWRRLRGDAA